MHVARPVETATLLNTSETSARFVSPDRFDAPLFVKLVKELVPFKMLATAVVVAYVELAVEVVK